MPSRRTDLPLYLGLYEDIKDKIVSGELAAGEKLPSIRAMARDLVGWRALVQDDRFNLIKFLFQVHCEIDGKLSLPTSKMTCNKCDSLHSQLLPSIYRASKLPKP